jgi:hypothetical protein
MTSLNGVFPKPGEPNPVTLATVLGKPGQAFVVSNCVFQDGTAKNLEGGDYCSSILT